MVAVIFWALAFSVTTSISIILLGSRNLIAGEINLIRLIRIIFSFNFLAGAFLAFLSRLFFIMTNNAIYKIPNLSRSSTTITTLINSGAVLVVIVANHYFLGERLSYAQLIGAFFVISGIFLVSTKF